MEGVAVILTDTGNTMIEDVRNPMKHKVTGRIIAYPPDTCEFYVDVIEYWPPGNVKMTTHVPQIGTLTTSTLMPGFTWFSEKFIIKSPKEVDYHIINFRAVKYVEVLRLSRLEDTSRMGTPCKRLER